MTSSLFATGYFCLSLFGWITDVRNYTRYNEKVNHADETKYIFYETKIKDVLRIKLTIPAEFDYNLDSIVYERFGSELNLDLSKFICCQSDFIFSKDLNGLLVFDLIYNGDYLSKTNQEFTTHELFNRDAILHRMNYFWSAIKFREFNECKPNSPSLLSDFRYVNFEFKSTIFNSVIVEQFFKTDVGACYISQLTLLLPIHGRGANVMCTYISLDPKMSDFNVMKIIRDSFQIEKLNLDDSNLMYYLDQLMMLNET